MGRGPLEGASSSPAALGRARGVGTALLRRGALWGLGLPGGLIGPSPASPSVDLGCLDPVWSEKGGFPFPDAWRSGEQKSAAPDSQPGPGQA